MKRYAQLLLTACCGLSLLPVLAGAGVPPPPNMVLWLPFDEAAGGIAHNAQAGNNGMLRGAVPPVHAPGEVANALRFNANDDVNVLDYPAINFAKGKDFSIDAWILPSPNGIKGKQRITDKRLDLRPAGGPLVGYSLYLQDGKLALEISDGSSAVPQVILGPPVPLDGRWHLVAATVCHTPPVTGGPFGATLYVDATAVGPFPLTQGGDLTNVAPFRVGRNTSTPLNEGFLGGIDEVEVFSRCLSFNEVITLLQAGPMGKTKETCSICWDHYFDINTPNQTSIPDVTITNLTGAPQTYTYQFVGLPVMPGANKPGPTTFTPAIGAITVPGNTTVMLPAVQMDRPVWFTTPGTDSGFFKVVFTNASSGNQFSATSHAWDRRNIVDASPPCSMLTANGGAKTPVNGIKLVNPKPTAIFLSLEIVVMGPDGNLDTTNVSLNGQAPGTPTFVDVLVPGNGSVPVPNFAVQFLNYDPNRPYSVLILADLNGTGDSQPLFSATLTNAIPPTGITVKGRLSLEGVPDLAATSAAAPLGAFHVAFRDPNTTNDEFAADVTLDTTQGGPFAPYTITGVPAGVYDVWIKGDKNLAVLSPNVGIDSANSVLPAVQLPGGDANNDNRVDVLDFGALVNAYGAKASDPNSGYDPTADFDFNGIVDVLDFGELVNNYGAVGAR